MYFIFSNMNFYNEILVHSYTGGFFLFKFACGYFLVSFRADKI